jgi:hypothetical protein
MRTITTATLSLILSLALAACSSLEQQPIKDYEEQGLDTVHKDSRSELYIRPDITIPLYHKLYIEPITVSYSSQKHSNSPGYVESDFQFDDNELAKFQEQFNKAVSEAWSKAENHIVLTKLNPIQEGEQTNAAKQETNNDTLIMRVSITDLYLYASIKNNKAGRNTALVNESSKMVINMDLLDARTNEVFIRSIDRRTTGYSSGLERQMSSVSYFNDVHQTFRSWINQLASRLD